MSLARGGHQASVGADARREDAAAVAGQPFQDLAAVRVDEREEALVAADDQQPAAGHIRHAGDGSFGDDREPRQRPLRLRVEQGDRAVRLSDGEDATIGAQGVAGELRAVASDREWAAEAAGAGEVPDQHLAVERGGVQGGAVAGQRHSGDLSGVSLECLDGRRRLTSHTISRLSAPAVTAVCPSAPKTAPMTRPSWRPEARLTSPVMRSKKRTEPSAPPTSSVRSSGLRVSCAAPVGARRSGRSV